MRGISRHGGIHNRGEKYDLLPLQNLNWNFSLDASTSNLRTGELVLIMTVTVGKKKEREERGGWD